MHYRVDLRSPRIRKGNWRKGQCKFDTREEAIAHKQELEDMVRKQGSDLEFRVTRVT